MGYISKIRRKIKDGSMKEIWLEWKWIYSYTKKYALTISGYLSLSVLGIVMGLVSSVASKNLIDIVTGFQVSRIIPMAILMVGMALAGILLNSVSSRIAFKVNLKIQNDIQAGVFEQIMDVDWQHLTHYHSGDILNRFGNDIKTVASSAMGWLPQLVTGVFSFLGSLALILYYDPTMALIALVNAPVMMFASRFLLGHLRKHTQEVKKADSEMVEFQEEAFYNVDSIKSFDLSGLFKRRLLKVQEHYYETNQRYNRFSIFTNMVLSGLGMVVEYSCFGWGIYRLWTGRITFGEMTLFLGQAGKLSATFNSLVSIVPSTLGATVSAGRIMELLKLPKERRRGNLPESFTKNESLLHIRLKEVDFAYVPDHPVLQRSEMTANSNEIIALVGPSGEGKTTIIRMLLGLIQPQRGQALLIDNDQNEIPMGISTRACFSYVPQGNTLFSGSVAENLRMVKEDATDEDIVEALKTACAYEFVSKLPGGIYGMLGEQGHGVSEGQAQRISIARAVLRDAPVLLLDEATSALDVATERKVLKNIVEKAPNKICIVTTHRPSVLNMCQRVYRIMDTRLVELTEEESARMAMDF